MNAYRELITTSRELARLARAAGLNLGTLRLVDLAQDAEAQLARDENERDNLRQTLEATVEALLEKPPPKGDRCTCCGLEHRGHVLATYWERKRRAEHDLRRAIERLGGPKAPVLLDREARVEREVVDFYGREP